MKRVLIVAALALAWPNVGAGQVTVYLREPAVRKDLKFTPEQAKVVEKALRDLQEVEGRRLAEESRRVKAALAAAPDAPPPVSFVRTGDLDAIFAEKVEKVLTKAQKQRLEEIRVQKQGLRVLVKPQIAERLNLSPETVDMIKEILQEQTDQSRAVVDLYQQQIQAGVFESRDDQMRSQLQIPVKIAQIKRDTEAQVLKLLTKKQRAKFKAMHGEPLKPDLPTAQPAPVAKK